jgi:hypothetical protein
MGLNPLESLRCAKDRLYSDYLAAPDSVLFYVQRIAVRHPSWSSPELNAFLDLQEYAHMRMEMESIEPPQSEVEPLISPFQKWEGAISRRHISPGEERQVKEADRWVMHVIKYMEACGEIEPADAWELLLDRLKLGRVAHRSYVRPGGFPCSPGYVVHPPQDEPAARRFKDHLASIIRIFSIISTVSTRA